MLHKLNEARSEATPTDASPAKEARWLNLHELSSAFSEETMLAYFLSALEVRAKLIKQLLKPDAAQNQFVDEVQEKLATFHEWCALKNRNVREWKSIAWCEAYRLELRLALAEPADKLLDQLQLRLDQLEAERVPAAARLRKASAAAIASIKYAPGAPNELPAKAEASLRSHLIDAIEALQWHLKKKYSARMIQKEATYKILWAALASFALFLSPYIVMYVGAALIGRPAMQESIAGWVGLPLITALTAGPFGAFFSRLLFIQSKGSTLSLDELKVAREFFPILLRGTVGMSGAALVYFFLQSNLISGDLVPNLGNIGLLLKPDPSVTSASIPHLVLPNRELALLAVWGFLAGFSERLVPNMLSTSEKALAMTRDGDASQANQAPTANK